MSFCFWLKSSGHYKGRWLTKGCWVVRKWLCSSHWTLFVLEVTLTLAKETMGDDTVGGSIPLITWEELVELPINWCRLAAINSQQDWKKSNKPNEMKYQPIQLPCQANRQNWSSAVTQVNCDDLKWMQLIFGVAWWMVVVGKCIKQPSGRCVCRRPCNAWPRVVSAISGTCYPCRRRSGWVGKIPKKMIQEKDHLKDDILKSVVVSSKFTP